MKLRLLVYCALAAAAWAQPGSRPTVLHAARLVDVENGKAIIHGEVLVEGDQIVAVGPSVDRPASAEVIDLGGRTLVTLQYFVTTTPTTTARYVDLATLLQVSHNNGFFVVLDLPVEPKKATL